MNRDKSESSERSLMQRMTCVLSLPLLCAVAPASPRMEHEEVMSPGRMSRSVASAAGLTAVDAGLRSASRRPLGGELNPPPRPWTSRGGGLARSTGTASRHRTDHRQRFGIDAGVTRIGRLPDVRLAVAPAQDAVSGEADPLLPFQWHLERIRWQQARQAFGEDGTGVVVAVIDTGVRFRADPPCTTGAAAEGELDLVETRFVQGHDFVDGDARALDEGYELLGDDPSGSPFLFGHGTFVAGLIAAGTDNGYGGAGVAPGVSIMPLRVVDRRGNAPASRIAAAIEFATDHGADVIHVSVAAAAGSSAMEEAVRRAHRAGAVLVAPAGVSHLNRGCGANGSCYPAAYAEVIAVAGTDPTDAASLSATADYLDLAAPGSWSPESECFWAPHAAGCDGILAASFIDEPSFGETTCDFFQGTGVGFAAAQVSAAAALLKAAGVADPEAIRTLLTSTARDLGPRGFDHETGHGLLDLYRAQAGFGFSF